MFSKADKSKAPAGATRAAPSLISTDLEIAGNLKTPGEVQLDGNVEGDIFCGKLIIGEKAVLVGQIEADEVYIRGRVTGQVRAASVHLAKTARVIGDVWHDSLAIEAGAFLEGHCKRNDTPKVATATTAAPPQAVVATGPQKVETAPSRKPEVAAARHGSVQGNAGGPVAKTATGR